VSLSPSWTDSALYPLVLAWRGPDGVSLTRVSDVRGLGAGEEPETCHIPIDTDGQHPSVGGSGGTYTVAWNGEGGIYHSQVTCALW
jgi:hypothetical protein